MALFPGVCRDAIARGLVGLMADEDLVQCEEPLAVLPLGHSHDPVLDAEARAFPRHPLQEGSHGRGRVLAKHAVIPLRIRIDPDRELPAQVLGRVGHQAILADDHHKVFWREEKAVQVPAVHPDPALIGRDRALGFGKAGVKAFVRLLVRGDVLTSRLQVETHLARGPVPLEQQLERRLPRDQDDAREVGAGLCHFPLSRTNRWTVSLKRSGVRFRCSIV